MLKKLGKEFIDIVNRPIEPSIIRKDYDKNKYISGYTVVRLLNELTNGAWSWQIDKTWTQETKDAKGTHTIYHMMGTLTLLFDDGNDGVISITKQGVAGKELRNGGKLAENIYKALETLCLRKAASYAGVGAELWLSDAENDYFDRDYEPQWTQEAVNKYKAEWDELGKIQKACELTDEHVDELVHEWNPTYPCLDALPPEKFPDFIKSLQDVLNADAEKVSA